MNAKPTPHPVPFLSSLHPQAVLATVVCLLAGGLAGWSAETIWNFDQPGNPLSAAQGAGALRYHDPDGTGWGAADTVFGTASGLGLPAMSGGDASVMRFPACAPRQGYRIDHGADPNGPYGETQNRVSNFTLILDVLYPSASSAQWRGLYQTDLNNADDAEFYVDDMPENRLGTRGIYHGSIQPDTWHRVAIVMQAAPGEGKCQRFIDGRFVGGIGSTGSGLDLRWSLADAFLLFADDNNETAPGYVSSVRFVDRALTFGEMEALGGPHADGANVAGLAAPPIEHQMPRRVGVIGHRGGDFCCTPDNTLASVRSAISNNVPVIEIDTRLSADGVCVLMHDTTVDRTTDGTGAVSSMTVAQLRTLDAGSWFSPDFAGERIPTAAEVMDIADGRLILYFDLKVSGQINAIVDALNQSGFDPEDCWFWTYNSASDAASIRAQLPGAKIIWGDPPGNWTSDPNYFSNLRSVGVYGFDLGVYYGTVNTAFLIAAKQAGFVVSIYTILDPDTMVRNAELGVDYMETDFPYVMNLIQPPVLPAVSGPTPVDGVVEVSQSPLLTWNAGQDAIAHRVHFGTENPPPFAAEQAYDIFPMTNLLAGTTYYWRVDEVTGSGTVPGEVWSFTTTFTPTPTNATYEWNFKNGDLARSLGNGSLAYADGATEMATEFGVTDGTLVPDMADGAAAYLRAPSLTAKENGYFLTFNDSGPNGAGAYINSYTLIADLLIPGSLNWTALFNTDVDNNNDADFYVAQDGSLGIGALGYSAAGVIQPDTWFRIAFAADLNSGTVTYFVNGTQEFQRTGETLLDQRFSLYSRNDARPSFLMFNEGDTSGVYTHELFVSAVAFTDRTLSADEVAALGLPHPEGIFTRRLHVTLTESGVEFTWRGALNVGLQRKESFSEPVWQDVAGTLGANSFVEETLIASGFYRLSH